MTKGLGVHLVLLATIASDHTPPSGAPICPALPATLRPAMLSGRKAQMVGRAGGWLVGRRRRGRTRPTRALAVMLAAALLSVAACSGSGRDSATTPTSEPPVTVPLPGVPSEGAVLAEVSDAGQVLTGEAVFDPAALHVDARRAMAPSVGGGVLAVGPGLDVEVTGEFEGQFQVRLDVPEPPTGDALPGAIHVRDDGTVELSAALWDSAASQIVLRTSQFSSLIPGWFDPVGWMGGAITVAGGTVDFLSDYITGRTDPPPCRNDAPAWFAAWPHDISSVHLCIQGDVGEHGDVRAEVYLKSNRRTAQLIRLPDVATDYVWSERLGGDIGRAAATIVGADPNRYVLLMGEAAMSVGMPRPQARTQAAMSSHLNPTLSVVNPVLALFGNIGWAGILGVTGVVADCVLEVTGIDPLNADLSFDQPSPADFANSAMCALKVLSEPELAVEVFNEAAEIAGIDARLSQVGPALKGLADTATRILSGTQIASALTNAWDGTADQLAGGRIDLLLAAPPATTTTTPFPRPLHPQAAAPACPPDIGAESPRYVYAAMCFGDWAVVLESGCASGRSNGWIFTADRGGWHQVGGPGAFDGWPAPPEALSAHGVPPEVAAEFAAAPDRPPDDGTCTAWVVPGASAAE